MSDAEIYNENPFQAEEEGVSKDFEIAEDVNLSALRDQIAETLGDAKVQVAISGLAKPFDAPSKDNPGTLYVHSAKDDLDGRKVRGAITAHKPDGVAKDPQVDARQRLLGGEDLSLAEVNAVLRSLLSGS